MIFVRHRRRAVGPSRAVDGNSIAVSMHGLGLELVVHGGALLDIGIIPHLCRQASSVASAAVDGLPGQKVVAVGRIRIRLQTVDIILDVKHSSSLACAASFAVGKAETRVVAAANIRLLLVPAYRRVAQGVRGVDSSGHMLSFDAGGTLQPRAHSRHGDVSAPTSQAARRCFRGDFPSPIAGCQGQHVTTYATEARRLPQTSLDFRCCCVLAALIKQGQQVSLHCRLGAYNFGGLRSIR
eukprot:scaffold553265_cov51-Prasinocladus_malaysianus.AAC.3